MESSSSSAVALTEAVSKDDAATVESLLKEQPAAEHGAVLAAELQVKSTRVGSIAPSENTKACSLEWCHAYI